MDGEGILVRTAFLARRASTSKSRLKKGSRAVLRPDGVPPVPMILPTRLVAPTKDPGQGLLGRDTISIMRQEQVGEIPPSL